MPTELRKEMLFKIHYGHLGIDKCKNRARECLFWKNMDQDIEKYVKGCLICNKYKSSNQKEPMVPHEIPKWPWEKVGTDIFELNNIYYLLVIDYFSKFVEISILNKITSKNVITSLKSIFARHGIPKTVVSDGGSQFTSSEFKNFASVWNFKQVTSSPRYPQSNGMAERTIQTVKRTLKKALDSKQDPYLALLELRNTSTSGLPSPAKILMGRNLRGLLPENKEQNNLNFKKIHDKIKYNQKVQKSYYDRGSRKLTNLSKGQRVFVKNNSKNIWEPGTIKNLASRPRSYEIELDSGSLLQRNRKFLNPLSEYDDENNTENNIPTTAADTMLDKTLDESFATPATYTNTTTSYGREVKPPSRLQIANTMNKIY